LGIGEVRANLYPEPVGCSAVWLGLRG
jgi:hypothetical protein